MSDLGCCPRHLSPYVCMYVCMYAYMYLCMYACLCVCVCVCVCLWILHERPYLLRAIPATTISRIHMHACVYMDHSRNSSNVLSRSHFHACHCGKSLIYPLACARFLCEGLCSRSAIHINKQKPCSCIYSKGLVTSIRHGNSCASWHASRTEKKASAVMCMAGSTHIG